MPFRFAALFTALLLACSFALVDDGFAKGKTKPKAKAKTHAVAANPKKLKKKSPRKTAKKAAAPAAAVNAANYQQCTALVEKDPGGALKTADQSLKKRKDSAMRHCRALALFSLKRYEESARELEGLAGNLPSKQSTLWLSVMRQAATARELAGQLSAARDDLAKAVHLAGEKNLPKDATELLLERARISRGLNKPLEAVQDLDHALTLAPGNPDALQARAETFIELKQYDMAREDLTAVTQAHPENKEAQEMLRKVRGK